jgi:hypothetical protein
MKANVFVQKLRRILRAVVRESAHRHDPLLINSMAAFNFRQPLRLEFSSASVVRYRALSQ